MKLLIAADIFPPESGGPATYAVTLANEFTKQGIEVKIVSLNPNSDKTKVNCPLFAVQSNFKLLRYWQYYKLLLTHGRDVDVIYAMGPVNAGWPALRVARKLDKKFVVKVVGDYAWEQGQVIGIVKDSIDDFQKKNYGGKIGRLKKIEADVAQHANDVIVPSKYLAKLVEGWGVDTKKIKMIRNGEVDFNLAKPVEHPEEKWLVSVGRLVPWKGMDTLIDVIAEIFKEYPEWRLKIVGDGPEMENLKKKIVDPNLAHIVELTGNLPKEKTLSYIASADVFILNSGYEGLSHVLVEAHNQGVPVLASNAGGNSEIVADDYLFEYNNKEEIKKKILQKSVVGKGKSIPHYFKGKESTMINDTKEVLEQTMKQLMISLDKKILDPTSAVAQRMIEYGKENELFILIPHHEKKEVQLSNMVHVWSTGGNKLQQYVRLKKMGRNLVQKNNIKLITVQDPSFIGNVGRWLKKKTGVKLEVQVHGDFFNSNYYVLLKDHLRYSWFGKKNLLCADRVRVVGERVKNSIVRLGVPEEKIEIRPVSIDKDSKISLEKNLHKEFPEYDKLFLFMGRLEEIKNVSWLINVLVDIKEEYKKNFLLLIVGDGSEKKYLQSMVTHRHFENNVRFVAWTPNPFVYYRGVDCVLFPSLNEGYGLVPMEAYAAGCKVIMNDVGVANYELKPSEKVTILPVNDREAWKKAILSV